MSAAILLPARLVPRRALGTLFAVADGRQFGCRDAEVNQEIASGRSPAIAQRQVVLIGPALVAVTFDEYASTSR